MPLVPRDKVVQMSLTCFHSSCFAAPSTPSPPLRDDDDLYNLVAPRRMLHNNKEAKSKLLTGTVSSDLRNNKTKSSSTALHDPAAQSTAPTPSLLLGLALHTLRLVGAVRQKKRRLNIFFFRLCLLFLLFLLKCRHCRYDCL